MTFLEIAIHYFQLGFIHVLPYGFDHILFILSLFFLNSNFKSVLIQCSIFTIAHSITLALAATKYIIPNTNIIEPLIAVSILFTAIENIIHDKINIWRLIIIFGFGLIHGLGFANALNEVGLPQTDFINSLIFFNIGVEFGQITIIFLTYFSINKWLKDKKWYKEKIVYPISSIIGCIALYWTIERLFFVN